MRSNLAISRGVVEPDRALLFTDGCDERTAVGRERNALFLGRAESDLLGRTVRIALTPDVKSLSGVSGKVHPLSVRRPGRIRALGWLGTDLLSGRAAVERHEPARQPAGDVHFHRQHGTPIGRQIRTMRHAVHIAGEINLALFRATLRRRENTHMQAFTRPSGKHDSRLASGSRDPTRGAHGEPVVRASAEDRHGPGVRYAHRVGDARAVRRKGERPHFGEAVVRKLHGLAIGKQFDVDLAVSDERGVSADERQDAAVRRKRRSHGGIGKVGQLDVLAGSRGREICGRDRRILRRLPATR